MIKEPSDTRLDPDHLSELPSPRQWLPSFIRWPFRLIVLPFIWLDLGMQRLAALIIRPPYKMEGKCLKRGACCKCILMPQPKGLLSRFFYFWNTQVVGFYPRQKRPITIREKKMVIMGCRHLKKDGTCAAYLTRPTLCRQWPRARLFGKPALLKGCGFTAHPRHKA